MTNNKTESTRANNQPAGVNNYEFYVLTDDGAFFIVADYLDPDLSQGAKLYVYSVDPNAYTKVDIVAWFKNAILVLRNPIALALNSKPVGQMSSAELDALAREARRNETATKSRGPG